MYTQQNILEQVPIKKVHEKVIQYTKNQKVNYTCIFCKDRKYMNLRQMIKPFYLLITHEISIIGDKAKHNKSIIKEHAG